MSHEDPAPSSPHGPAPSPPEAPRRFPCRHCACVREGEPCCVCQGSGWTAHPAWAQDQAPSPQEAERCQR